MAEGDSPTVARRRVRLAIREAREPHNLTQQQVAEQMEWSLSKVIRIESGEVSISVNDLRPLLPFLGRTWPTTAIDPKRWSINIVHRANLPSAMICVSHMAQPELDPDHDTLPVDVLGVPEMGGGARDERRKQGRAGGLAQATSAKQHHGSCLDRPDKCLRGVVVSAQRVQPLLAGQRLR